MEQENAPPTDSELIESCLAGDDGAWAELIERYAALVASVPARAGIEHDLRDEVFQSVWTIAVRHLGSLRDHRSLPAWLIRTAQRESWRIARQARRAAGFEAAEAPAWADTDEAELLEDRQHLREAMEVLGERCRELLTALFREDRPDYDRIARDLGMARGSIGPTRGRCLDKLKSLYDQRAAGRVR